MGMGGWGVLGNFFSGQDLIALDLYFLFHLQVVQIFSLVTSLMFSPWLHLHDFFSSYFPPHLKKIMVRPPKSIHRGSFVICS